MAYWLIKSEPEEYGWQDLVAERRGLWDGVRNAEAKGNLARMRVGDRAFFYHSGPARAIVGVVKVVRAAFPDPQDPRWLAVEVAPARALARPVGLAEVKSDKRFTGSALVRKPRLSVQPVAEAHWKAILALSEADG